MKSSKQVKQHHICLKFTKDEPNPYPPAYKDVVVTEEVVKAVYQELDDLGSEPLQLDMDEEEVDALLRRHLNRKRDCGNYRLKRDIVINLRDRDAINRMTDKYHRMVEAKVLRCLP
jgi:hypothetical protein